MWLEWSFVALGFLMGNLVGLSADSLAKTLLGLLFAFIGGSVFAFLHRLAPDDRRLAGKAMLGLSVGCLLGVYTGIIVTQRQLLSPPTPAPIVAQSPDSASGPAAPARPPASQVPTYYLRTELLNPAAAIDAQLNSGALTQAQAYRQLLDLVQRAARQP